jgi:hypothetical protein
MAVRDGEKTVKGPQNKTRDREILEQVRRGDPYQVIGDRFNLTPSRISGIATQAGIYRRKQRKKSWWRKVLRKIRETLDG